ncbi:iron-containing redox enzyme family protein [Pseudomonas sp. MWU15-20650]|uniref:iron-containing redox enzyme family protein n=1 Tax=Pseudomonas sp. MWU15-20650 TaxID=2933107 RepID=UPI00200BDEC1|nr:iron-containing redox enzyme family protein [Pseudomonas sp. MWU15-20650]
MTCSQKLLFRANRALIENLQPIPDALLSFEQQWIERSISESMTQQQPGSLSELRRMLEALIEQERGEEPPTARYVAQEMTLDEFKILVQEFALDGLTEAQVFYHLMPRLNLEAQMPMLRMMIDEFGSGNIQRSHTSLYKGLLKELGMPTDLESHIQANAEAGCSFPNMFCWLTMRADDPSYFAGVITYFETVVPFFFSCYTTLCDRLGIKAHTYYSEHVHIDVFHALEGQRLLKAMDNDRKLDYRKAWQGICMGRLITNNAFDQAVYKAQASKVAEGAAHA